MIWISIFNICFKCLEPISSRKIFIVKMANHLLLIFLAPLIGLITQTEVTASDCWWSGCQPFDWAERGCSKGYHQINSKPCSNGDMYHCCPSTSTNNEVVPPASESGICSWYGAEGEIPPGHPTASGEGFDRFAMKAAHKTLPFGTRIRVKNEENGKTVDLSINDRGPFTPGRIVDLTYGAFGRIENHDKGVVKCSYIIL